MNEINQRFGYDTAYDFENILFTNATRAFDMRPSRRNTVMVVDLADLNEENFNGPPTKDPSRTNSDFPLDTDFDDVDLEHFDIGEEFSRDYSDSADLDDPEWQRVLQQLEENCRK